MFIATLFQVGEYISTNEILTVLSISFTLVFLYGLALSFKILVTHGKGNWSLKNNLRTLISLIVLLIRNLLYKIMFIKREFSLFSFN
jgi:ABC-type tungstate transport system substrate-binding protein